MNKNVIYHVIHESNSAMSYVANGVSLIKVHHKNGTLTDELLFEFLDFILKGRDKNSETIDYLYREYKKTKSEQN